MTKHYIIPIFVPHLGCPHDCVFCNQRKITNQAQNTRADELKETIDRYLTYFRKNSFIEIAFYGGSFTAIDMEIQKELLSIAHSYKEKKIINEIRISTRPDAIDDEILSMLKRFTVDTIELGVQSLDNQVLMASGRGHLKEDVYKAVNLIKDYKFKLGLQMMVGLPKDDIKKSIDTAMEFVRLKPDCVRIYPTLVIRDTYLEKMAKVNKYKSLTIEEAVDMVTPILILFYLNNINVIRVGLQATENIQLGYDVVEGPFHPSFRQLVESKIYKIILDEYFDNSKLDTANKILTLKINNKDISNLAGQYSHNKEYLVNKYNFKKVKIKASNQNDSKLYIEIDGFTDQIDIMDCMKEILENRLSLMGFYK